jgi:hypothetical protein
MARVKIRLDQAGLRADADRAAGVRVRTVSRRILNRSAILCPVDTGRLRASGRMQFREGARGPRGRVEYPVRYAAAVHDGTGPHIIRARKKKALRFQYHGQVVFAKSVRHPGTRGRPFLRRAAAEIAAAEGLRFIPHN